MAAAREIEALTPACQKRVRALQGYARDAQLDLLIYCTYRTVEEQARLYRRGRTLARIQRTAGRLNGELDRPDLADVLLDVGPQMDPVKVTNAAPGMSAHNYREAFDAVPMIGGKPLWRVYRDRLMLAEWAEYGRMAVDAGLEWAGNWTRFREYVHSQEPDFSWRARICGYQFR